MPCGTKERFFTDNVTSHFNPKLQLSSSPSWNQKNECPHLDPSHSIDQRVPCFTLRNGVQLPSIGLGTSHSGGYCHETVVCALQSGGYRLIDTAKRYGCESMLRESIEESTIRREELFLSTKLWPRDYGYKVAVEALAGSLNRLGTDYLDLFMLHWPEVSSDCSDKWGTIRETWRALELAYDNGICRAIGVSNFECDDLDKLLDDCSVVPHVNQIEFHPFHNPKSLLECCSDMGIQVQGYSPLGKGKILNDEKVSRVADRINRSTAQVLLRWSYQNRVATVPKSTKIGRVFENINVFDFELAENDMDILDNMHDGRRYVSSIGIKQKIDSDLPDGYKLYLN